MGNKDCKTLFVREFTNGYGDKWTFKYHVDTGRSYLSGSDVDWRKYEVVLGTANVTLGNEEQDWLLDAWVEAVESTTKTVGKQAGLNRYLLGTGKGYFLAKFFRKVLEEEGE